MTPGRPCTARPGWPCGRWIGGRELDQFLANKDAVAKELEEVVRQRVAALGLEVISVGIRDQPSVGARSCRAT